MSKEELKTISLGYGERMLLTQLLGEQQGNQITARVTQRFIEELSLTEEEIAGIADHANIGIEVNPKEFIFTDWRLTKIKDILKNLDASGSVKRYHIPLFDKFLPPPDMSEDAALAEEYERYKGREKLLAET